MKVHKTTWIAACFLAGMAGACAAETLSITVQTDQPGERINPAMWGVFFEDINFGADGGLYAELVKNRSFEFPDPLMGWRKLAPVSKGGPLHVLNQNPLSSANPHYLNVDTDGDTPVLLANEGFRGMGIRSGESYLFTVQARSLQGSPALEIRIKSADGTEIATARTKRFTSQWKGYSATLRAHATDPKAHLELAIRGTGTLDLDMVSLFPKHTWRNRPGGLRADLVQMLADLKPGFMRFPGGCIVEGRYLTNRYQWKTTIGAPADRKLIINRWNDEFKHRPAPDYYQSFGLGFFEFFQTCEDIGAEPLPILNCGMACQFNSGELAPMDQFGAYLQDALDLIEFANGPASSPWGARRAAMGHPAPFNVKMLGVGNEQWGEQYFERYALFARKLKERHPEIQLVSSAGPAPADERFDLAWKRLRDFKADIVDEHCYAAPQWFLDNANRYDRYDRNGPKVFMGEYAAQSVGIAKPENRNDWECALAEAAYMTGMERNADVVRMASYAPLFGHIDGWQWTPNLIWCDNLRVYGTPNYYVQQLFSRNRGDTVLPVKCIGEDTKSNAPARLYTSAVRAGKQVILKVVNAKPEPVIAGVELAGCQRVSRGKATVLTGGLKDENSLDQPANVAPLSYSLPKSTKDSHFNFEPYSFTVLKFEIVE
jgi:alpha-L-arabinofuranosidase